jgi:Dickkopf N-terminal cysteine-rich region
MKRSQAARSLTTLLAAFALFGCHGSQGAEGSDCRGGDPASHCAAGLFCKSSGRMIQDGSNFYYAGKCAKSKAVGEACTTDDECARPAVCLPDSPPSTTERLAGTSARPGHCRQ